MEFLLAVPCKHLVVICEYKYACLLMDEAKAVFYSLLRFFRTQKNYFRNYSAIYELVLAQPNLDAPFVVFLLPGMMVFLQSWHLEEYSLE